MDLLESGDEREPRSLRDVRLPGWAVVLVGVLAVAVAAAGLGTAALQREEQERAAERLEVEVRPVGTTSTTVRGVARGELSLLLVNRREQRVRLGELRVAVEGLRVTSVQPAFGQPLGAFEERLFRIGFVVPDCSRLVLPGRLRVSLAADGQPVERRELAVVDPDLRAPGRAGLTLGGCPPSARGRRAGTADDLAVRPVGGTAARDGVGARGVLRLEVANAGPRVQLISLDGEVPGVRFARREIPEGRSIETDGAILLTLPFAVDDCAALQPAGRLVLVVERAGAQQELGLRAVAEPEALVLVVERAGAQQELGLRAVAEPEAGVGPQVDLGLLFRACD